MSPLSRFTLLILPFLLASCRYHPPRTEASASIPESRETHSVSVEGTTAVASWYGHPYHGRRTANGEVYDMNLLTAAHRTWPFNTLVRVTHLANKRSVLVRINDRGPFVAGREIDLSREAARRLDMIEEGTARVRLQILENGGSGGAGEDAQADVVRDFPRKSPASSNEDNSRYRLQMGAFSSEKNARRLLNRLVSCMDELGLEIVSHGRFFRVQSVQCFDELRGEALREQLRKLGFESILRRCDGQGS